MQSSKTIRVTICLFLVIIYSCGIQRTHDQIFTFIQITDPQFGFISNNKGFSEETVLFEKAVSRINLINPAFVIITGDMVNDKTNKSQWDEFRRLLSMINRGIKVYLVPGNHDVGQNSEKKDLDFYKSMFGYDRFSFEYGKCRFIGFNSSKIKSGAPDQESEQFEWLKKELASSQNAEKIFLFCHYPFFIKDPGEPENYSNINPEMRRKYLTMFSEYGVDAVFSGHLHNNASGIFNKIEMITTSASGKPLSDVPSGFRIVTVSKEGFTHQYSALDSVGLIFH